MKQSNNLSQIFENICKTNPNKIAVKLLNKNFTYDDIYKLSNNYIIFLKKKKLKIR